MRIVDYPDLNPCHLLWNMEIMIQTLHTVSLGVWCHSKSHVVPYHRRTETSILLQWIWHVRSFYYCKP